eukprot:TRINITY_DN10162_c0_g1_i1.p1 TRINITY_DN10162_c0_g1~~TRINITY_DN10162_c0_g1_i1.p1  ORF type:complete len:424 (+),score=85.86 TRINITY_DN10162_c0_g1_i1:118-1389(+)
MCDAMSREDVELRVRRWAKGRISMRCEDVVELVLSIMGEKDQQSSMCSTEPGRYDADKCRWLSKVASDPKFAATVQTTAFATGDNSPDADVYQWMSVPSSSQCTLGNFTPSADMTASKKSLPAPLPPPPLPSPIRLGSSSKKLPSSVQKRKLHDQLQTTGPTVKNTIKRPKKKKKDKKKGGSKRLQTPPIDEPDTQLFRPSWFDEDIKGNSVNESEVAEDIETEEFFKSMKTGDIQFLGDTAELSQPELLEDELGVGSSVMMSGETDPLSRLKPRNMARGVLLDHPSTSTPTAKVKYPSLDINWQINPNLYTTEEVDSTHGWSFLLRNDEASVDTLPAFPHADEDKKPLAIIAKHATVSGAELQQRARAKASLLSFTPLSTHIDGRAEPIKDDVPNPQQGSSFRCVFRDPPSLSSAGVELPIR